MHVDGRCVSDVGCRISLALALSLTVVRCYPRKEFEMSRLTMLGPIFVLMAGIAGVAQAQPCGSITSVGCCADDSTLKWCSSNVLKTKTCNGANSKCGWETTDKGSSWYTCTTATSSDPTSTHPRLCSAIRDGGTADKSTVTPCGSITSTGCCDGQTVKYCSSGSLKTRDCSSNLSCGWGKAHDYGSANYTCGTAGAPDPSGTHPMSCSSSSSDGSTSKDQSTTKKDQSSTTPDTNKHVDSAVSPNKSDSGCGCSIARAPAVSASLLCLLGAAVLALFASRRRR